MIATSTNYLALIEQMPPGAVTIIPDVDWGEYKELSSELDERSAIRLAYDRGRLQIMTLSITHERITALFPHLIMVLAVECGVNFIGVRSTTLRKEADQKGIEADDCCYFKDYKRMGQRKTLDLSVDPPPELAFEMDITSPSLNKFPIYAAVGIPELWRHTGDQVHFYRLEADEYIEVDRSDLFPFLSPEAVFSFLSIGESEGAVGMAIEFREWIKNNKENK